MYDSLKVFRGCYVRLGKDNLVDNLKDMNIELGNLNKKSIKNCVKKWISILEKNPKCQDDVFQAWFEQIILFPIIEKIVDNFQIQLLPEYFQNHFTSVE